jgi:hypothetical protein
VAFAECPACHYAKAVQPIEGLQMADTLVIVRRHQFAKFALLAQAFAAEAHVRLIWDRRLREQRCERASSRRADRRRRDRRCDPSKTWGLNDYLLLGMTEQSRRP